MLFFFHKIKYLLFWYKSLQVPFISGHVFVAFYKSHNTLGIGDKKALIIQSNKEEDIQLRKAQWLCAFISSIKTPS